MGARTANNPPNSGAPGAALHRALEQLPRDRSRLLELYHFDGLSVAQIAARLGVSERAVEGRLRRARHGLRRQLQSFADAGGEIA
jgi:DNA-directed RNA polymerase specialized sigma24 family protein